MDYELLAKALLLIHGETDIDQRILDAVADRDIDAVKADENPPWFRARIV